MCLLSFLSAFKGTETFVKPIKMIKDKSDQKYSYYSFKVRFALKCLGMKD